MNFQLSEVKTLTTKRSVYTYSVDGDTHSLCHRIYELLEPWEDRVVVELRQKDGTSTYASAADMADYDALAAVGAVCSFVYIGWYRGKCHWVGVDHREHTLTALCGEGTIYSLIQELQ